MKFCAKVVKIGRNAKTQRLNIREVPVFSLLLSYIHITTKREELLEFLSFSDSLGARTQDPILKRDVLYLLS